MFFKLILLIISIIQFIGWEILFLNETYEEEKTTKVNIPSNLFIFLSYILINSISWFMVLFGETFSTNLEECKCIKYLFKTTKYCLRDFGYYSRSVLINCASSIVLSLCISAINLTYGGTQLYLSLKREYDRKSNPELSKMPGFIVSSVVLCSIFCTLALISFITLSSITIDIFYQIYTTEPCIECSINGYCSSKLKVKRDQEIWKWKRRLHIFSQAFLGKEFADKMAPFDEETVKFDLIYNKDEVQDADKNNGYVPLFREENIIVTNYNDKTL